MCIVIKKSHEDLEFNPMEPLENQIRNSNQVVIDYDPIYRSTVSSFMEQLDRIVKNGVSCKINIKVNNNHYLDGKKLDRQLKKFSVDLDVNEVVKTLVNNHLETDRRLEEISEMCMEKVNEQ